MPAGLYIHIPFCKSRCIYCEFYSQTEKYPVKYIDAVLREAEAEQKTWTGETFDTLYFGGGTPSLIPAADLNKIVKELKRLFHFASDCEITLECNPDDISEPYAADVAEAGINRVSVGVQSFDDGILRFLSRRHDAAAAERAIAHFRSAGIENIGIDLIYGIPGLTRDKWKAQLKKALTLHVKHVSCYMLTVHESTKLKCLYEGGDVIFPSEEDCYEQYLDTRDILSGGGIMPYEISNFSMAGYESRHNIKYWKGKPWLGLGPSAHSYCGGIRWANPSDAELYGNNMNRFIALRKTETTDKKTQYNEYVMNRIRMETGIDTGELLKDFPQYSGYFLQQVKQLNKGWCVMNNGRFSLSAEGMFVSDFIIGRLFV